MTTYNTAVTPTWTKLADSNAGDLLVTWSNSVTVEFATTGADVAPVVSGHKLGPDSAITRSLIGAGFVWARLIAGSKPASVTLVVSK